MLRTGVLGIKIITKECEPPIRKGLLAIAGLDEDEYTDVLLQGSGTYCVEATIGAAVKPTDKLLILANGAYGKRMAQIAGIHHIDYVIGLFARDGIGDW